MPSNRDGRIRRAAASVAATVLLVPTATATLVIGSAAPAQAHTDLVSQSPEPNSALSAPPTEIRLQFTEPLLEVGAAVMIVDADAANWADGDPQLSGPVVTQRVRPGLPAGNYQVRWRVVSADGHRSSRSFGFAVGNAAGARPVPSVAALPEPAVAADADNSGDLDVAGAVEVEATSGSTRWVRTAAVAGVAATVGVALWVLVALARIRSPSRTDRTERSHKKGHT